MEHKVKQKSEEWYKLRKTVYLTASQFGDAVGVGRGKPYDFFKYIVSERNESINNQDGDYDEDLSEKNFRLKHGNSMEVIIREAYELLTGNYVEASGFWVPVESSPMHTLIGASPDGVVVDKADATRVLGLVEFKAPIYNLYSSAKLHGGIPRQYMVQIQGQMAVCSAPWCDFMAVCTKSKEIMLKRVYFQPRYWEHLATQIKQFCLALQEAEILRELGHGVLDGLMAEHLQRQKMQDELFPAEDSITVQNLLTFRSPDMYRGPSCKILSYDVLIGNTYALPQALCGYSQELLSKVDVEIELKMLAEPGLKGLADFEKRENGQFYVRRVFCQDVFLAEDWKEPESPEMVFGDSVGIFETGSMEKDLSDSDGKESGSIDKCHNVRQPMKITDISSGSEIHAFAEGNEMIVHRDISHPETETGKEACKLTQNHSQTRTKTNLSSNLEIKRTEGNSVSSVLISSTIKSQSQVTSQPPVTSKPQLSSHQLVKSQAPSQVKIYPSPVAKKLPRIGSSLRQLKPSVDVEQRQKLMEQPSVLQSSDALISAASTVLKQDHLGSMQATPVMKCSAKDEWERVAVIGLRSPITTALTTSSSSVSMLSKEANESARSHSPSSQTEIIINTSAKALSKVTAEGTQTHSNIGNAGDHPIVELVLNSVAETQNEGQKETTDKQQKVLFTLSSTEDGESIQPVVSLLSTSDKEIFKLATVDKLVEKAQAADVDQQEQPKTIDKEQFHISSSRLSLSPKKQMSGKNLGGTNETEDLISALQPPSEAQNLKRPLLQQNDPSPVETKRRSIERTNSNVARDGQMPSVLEKNADEHQNFGPRRTLSEQTLGQRRPIDDCQIPIDRNTCEIQAPGLNRLLGVRGSGEKPDEQHIPNREQIHRPWMSRLENRGPWDQVTMETENMRLGNMERLKFERGPLGDALRPFGGRDEPVPGRGQTFLFDHQHMLSEEDFGHRGNRSFVLQRESREMDHYDSRRTRDPSGRQIPIEIVGQPPRRDMRDLDLFSLDRCRPALRDSSVGQGMDVDRLREGLLGRDLGVRRWEEEQNARRLDTNINSVGVGIAGRRGGLNDHPMLPWQQSGARQQTSLRERDPGFANPSIRAASGLFSRGFPLHQPTPDHFLDIRRPHDMPGHPEILGLEGRDLRQDALRGSEMQFRGSMNRTLFPNLPPGRRPFEF